MKRSRLAREVSGVHQRWVRFLIGRDDSIDVEVDFYTVLTLPYRRGNYWMLKNDHRDVVTRRFKATWGCPRVAYFVGPLGV